jgi:hypothetical protein
VNGIQNRGQLYDVEIDLSGCQIEDSMFELPAVIYGGVAWETYVSNPTSAGGGNIDHIQPTLMRI